MTSTSSGGASSTISKVHSRIDYTYCSSTLAPRLSRCDVDHSPRHWTRSGTPRLNYHAALVTQFTWPGLWGDAGPCPAKNAALKGTTLPRRPNYARLTPERAATISRAVNEDLRGRVAHLRGIRKSAMDPSQKRDH